MKLSFLASVSISVFNHSMRGKGVNRNQCGRTSERVKCRRRQTKHNPEPKYQTARYVKVCGEKKSV